MDGLAYVNVCACFDKGIDNGQGRWKLISLEKENDIDRDETRHQHVEDNTHNSLLLNESTEETKATTLVAKKFLCYS